jgi:hypothetical protein
MRDIDDMDIFYYFEILAYESADERPRMAYIDEVL